MNKKYLHRPGTSLLEVMLAIGILSILAVTVFPTIGNLIRRTRKLQYDTQASLVLQEGIESAYNVFLADWDETWSTFPSGTYHPAVVNDGSGNKWTLLPNSQTGVEARYFRQVELIRVCRNSGNGSWRAAPCSGGYSEDPNSKLVRTTVRWDDFGTTKEIRAELLLGRMVE